MEYNHQDIEKRWREFWEKNKTFSAKNDSTLPKYYVLDMFPYPSGAGLHVGHPLGYIASDIVARYKKLCGYNVLHPMGFDAFGLPAEQYAIQTGKHPATTTAENIARYIEQLHNIGFAYDWDRQVNTSEPEYYKWTQWIFLQLFHHWYDEHEQKARHIDELISIFEKNGNEGYDKQLISGNIEAVEQNFTAEEWNSFSEKTKSDILMCYRLAYQSFAYVNWCEALGTVLANDEVKDGVSERGGHPVERRQMRQWFLRITAYAERLYNDLNTLDWSESMKEMQRNWIGKSEGALIKFQVKDTSEFIDIFTTRPDTIYGVSFMVLAPESEWVQVLTTADKKVEVEKYVNESKNRSERERQADVKRISGVFTGSYCIHPFTKKEIPIWTSEYVLAGYGTGAVMAVPGHDGRDFRFARYFGLPVPRVIAGADGDQSELIDEAYEAKDGMLMNSDLLDGMNVKEAIQAVIMKVEKMGIGVRQINYRLRDANFSRQRYWGEPFPIYYKEGIATPLLISELPLELPAMEDFKPTGNPEGPLAKLADWKYKGKYQLETDTMPGFAGSSWYFLRYMDAGNPDSFASKEALKYWQDVDFYIGGTEHAVGHLLYSRFWHKFLFDLNFVPTVEPFKKLVNQGMIQGVSAFVYIGHPPSWYSVDYPPPKNYLLIVSKERYDKLLANDRSEIIRYVDFYDRKICCIPNDVAVNITSDNCFQRYQRDTNDIIALGFWKRHVLVNDVNPTTNKISVDDFRKDRKISYGDHSEVPIYVYGDDENNILLEREVEKMSKSKLNVVNPDQICEDYGADTLRMYEMFLGPIEQSKPWNTNGITGVSGFLKKLWRICVGADGNLSLTNEEPNAKELKTLHKTIKKIKDDIEGLSLNTSVSAFMICLNELSELKCNKKAIYEPLLIILSPFAPHIAEELWSKMGHTTSIAEAKFPEFKPELLVENSFSYPVSFNGKHRFNLELPLGIPNEQIQETVLKHPDSSKWLEGKAPKKVIIVPGKIVNVVV
jgi:leucyl-tRNA synthetase